MIALGEGYKTEFREKTGEPLQAALSICAFSNSRGGNLFFGVGQRGDLVGVLDCRLELEKIEAALALIIPRPDLTAHRVPLHTCDILYIEIVEGKNKPYGVRTERRTRSYIRVEAENIPANKKVLRSIAGGGRRSPSRHSRDREILYDLFEREKRLSFDQIRMQLQLSERKTRRVLSHLARQGHVLPSLSDRDIYYRADRL
jgi:predicted HTH transcriptional regulator